MIELATRIRGCRTGGWREDPADEEEVRVLYRG
jgi:hypothetical protein